MPVYNSEKYLHECIDSILDQTVSDFELICVDDGSQDNSLQILHEYQAKDSRIKVFTQKNQYAGVARNNGLSHAKGKYILFLDSDDFFENNLIEQTVTLAESTNADIVLFAVDIYDQQKNKINPTPKELKLEYLPGKSVFNKLDIPNTIFQIGGTGPVNKLYLRSFIETHGHRFPGLKNSEDVTFVGAALASADRITCCKDVLLHVRRGHGTNLESTKDANAFEFYKAYMLLKEYLIEHNSYDLVEKSYINRAFKSCAYQVKSLKTDAARKEVLEFLLFTGFRELNITNKPLEYFDDIVHCIWFKLICRKYGMRWNTGRISIAYIYRALCHVVKKIWFELKRKIWTA